MVHVSGSRDGHVAESVKIFMKTFNIGGECLGNFFYGFIYGRKIKRVVFGKNIFTQLSPRYIISVFFAYFVISN